MLNDVEYMMEEPRRKPRLTWPATAALLTANVVVWLFQSWLYRYHPNSRLEDYFALSVEGLRHGYLWQLLTYQFMHAVPAPWHLVLNCWMIFVFGRIVEFTVGWRRMLQLYFLSGIVGGLVQMLGMALLPALFGSGGAVGASASAFGLVAAFAVLYPRERLYVLLLFVIPLRMRATTFLWVCVAISVYGILEPLFVSALPSALNLDNFFGNVAHAAHLGGIVTGFLLARQLARRLARVPVPPPIIETDPKTSLKITSAPD